MDQIAFNKIATPSAIVAEHLVLWETVNCLLGGTAHMRAGGVRFLPIEPKEDPIEWESRLNRTTLDPYFKEGVSNFVSKIFAKELQVSDVPVELSLLLEDIDQQQRNLTQFAADVFRKAAAFGVAYILTDKASPPEPFTNKAQEIAAGLRPYGVLISPLNLLDIRSASFNGTERLALFRYSEVVTDASATGAIDDAVAQIREYRQRANPDGTPGQVEYTIYRKQVQNSQWYEYKSGTLPLAGIPIAIDYANRTAFGLGKPPLQHLAELNIEHWRKRSDLNNILHICNVPFMLAKSLSPQVDTHAGKLAPAFEVSVRKAVMTNNKDASIEWIEHTGATISVAMQDLERLEKRMKDLSNTITMPSSGDITATAAALAAAEANSDVKQMGLALQDALNTMLYYLAAYHGLQTYGRIEVVAADPADYADASDYQLVIQLFQIGAITREALIAEGKRRGTLALNQDFAAGTAPVTSVAPQAAASKQENAQQSS